MTGKLSIALGNNLIFRNFYDIIKVESKFGKEFFMQKIRIGIVGYGNLGKGVEYAVSKNADTELAAVFSRRDPGKIKTVLGAPVFSIEEIKNFKDKIDVMIMCGGSASDLPVQSVEFVKEFSIVDSFDTHAKIPEHFANIDREAKKSGKIGLISVGWDPGLFSMQRLLFEAVLPDGSGNTFWGRGVSQGHSDAVRRIDGVLDAKQYTIPSETVDLPPRAGWTYRARKA